MKFSILQAGGLQALVELALGDHEDSQVTTMAAKTLVMLGFTGWYQWDTLHMEIFALH